MLDLDGLPWSRVDELIDELRSNAVAGDALPESLAVTFHAGRLSAMLATPPFVIEDADLITDELCRFLPPLQASEIVVVWPACYELDGGEVWHAMTVHLWQRRTAERMTTRLVPVPIGGSPEGPSFEIDPPDPWSQRLAAALRRSPDLPAIMDTRFPPGFDVAIPPSSQLNGAVPLHLES